MLGFQHADLNFPHEFHHDDVHDLAGASTTAQSAPAGWPSCAQQGNPNTSVTSTTSTKKSDNKSGKKSNSDSNANGTKKKKTRYVKAAMSIFFAY